MDISTRILFTTAFVDIRRTDTHRSNAIYFDNFCRMIEDGFEYPLIVYTHAGVIEQLRSMRSFPPNITFVDVAGVDTFLKEPYIRRETEIMQSKEYMEKVMECRRAAPEHSNPKYTLVTHSKVSFLLHTRERNPCCEYYAWIDFGIDAKLSGGYAATGFFNPHDIDFSLLEKKIHCASIRIADGHYMTEEDFLKTNMSTIFAFSFIIHADIFDELYGLYEAKLAAWQRRGIADDEQTLLYMLYQDRKDLFKIFKINYCRGLYIENLNKGATPTIVHPVHPSDATYAMRTPAQCSNSLHIADVSKPLIVCFEPDARVANTFLTTAHQHGWETVWLGKNMTDVSDVDCMREVFLLTHVPASKQIVVVDAGTTVCCKSPCAFLHFLQTYPKPCVAGLDGGFTAPFVYAQEFLFFALTNKYTDFASAMHAYMRLYPDRMYRDIDMSVWYVGPPQVSPVSFFRCKKV